jgi:hypothetical protein
MNKNSKILLGLACVALSIPLLVSCGETVDEVSITYGALWDNDETAPNGHFYHETSSGVTSYFTTYSRLTSLVNKKENFIVVVLGSSTCACWSNFRDNLLYPYMKSNNLLVYLIKHEEFDATGTERFGLNVSSSNETVAIFKNGILSDQHDDLEGTTFASSYSVFSTWMSERLKNPTMLYVSNAQLDNLYKGQISGVEDNVEEFTIYFSRFSCGDCSYMSTNFLNNYLTTTANLSTSYIIDCDIEGIRANGGVVDQTQWVQWKKDYGMAYAEDNPEGFGGGYVPTLFHIKTNAEGKKIGDDVIDGADVYFNDDFVQNTDLTYSLQSTYFSQARLERQELAYLKSSAVATKILDGVNLGAYEGEESGLYSWYQTQAAQYHDPILKAFLDAYIGENK